MQYNLSDRFAVSLLLSPILRYHLRIRSALIHINTVLQTGRIKIVTVIIVGRFGTKFRGQERM